MSKNQSAKTDKNSTDLSIKSSVLFLIIGSAMTAFAAYLIYSFIFSSRDIDNYLPNDNLIYYVEIKDKNAPPALLEKDPQIQQKINNLLGSVLGIDINKHDDIFKEKIGLAIFDNPLDVESSLYWSVFLEIENQQKVEIFINELALDGEKIIKKQKNNLEILTVESRNIDCAIDKGFFICAKKNSLFFDEYEATIAGKQLSLKESDDFQKIQAQQDAENMISMFLRPQKITPLFNNKNQYLSFFMENLSAGSVVLSADEEQLNISIFFQKIAKSQFFDRDDDQTAKSDLLTFAPENTKMFLYGKNSQRSIEQSLNMVSKVDPEFQFFLLARLRALLNEFFGDQISLENDILPLLLSDYLIGFGKTANGFSPYLIVETDDAIFAEQKREKLINGFFQAMSSFVPEILDYPSSDDSVVQEVFPNKNAVQKIEKQYETSMLTHLLSEQKNHTINISLGRHERLILLGLDQLLMENIMKRFENNQKNLMPADIIAEFPLKSFSEFDEFFALNKDILEAIPQNHSLTAITKHIEFIDNVAGKIVRIPDSWRLDLVIDY